MSVHPGNWPRLGNVKKAEGNQACQPCQRLDWRQKQNCQRRHCFIPDNGRVIMVFEPLAEVLRTENADEEEDHNGSCLQCDGKLQDDPGHRDRHKRSSCAWRERHETSPKAHGNETVRFCEIVPAGNHGRTHSNPMHLLPSSPAGKLKAMTPC